VRSPCPSRQAQTDPPRHQAFTDTLDLRQDLRWGEVTGVGGGTSPVMAVHCAAEHK
jgi:hypothetical protein